MKPSFTGRVRAEWLSDGRTMRLLEDVSFLDSYGVRWPAYAGDEVDGASIPRFLWRAAGSPFVGKYRRASVIHDVWCRNQARDSADVHEMFFEAMRADGVRYLQAFFFWLAVRLFGPRFKGVT